MKKNIIVLMLFALIVVIYFVYGYFQRNQLLQNHELTSGTVTQCEFLPKTGGSINIHYEFKIKDRIIKGFSRSRIDVSKCEKYLTGKAFPVVYNPDNTELSTLIFTPSDFQYYGYSFPDSLKWVLQYIEE